MTLTTHNEWLCREVRDHFFICLSTLFKNSRLTRLWKSTRSVPFQTILQLHCWLIGLNQIKTKSSTCVKTAFRLFQKKSWFIKKKGRISLWSNSPLVMMYSNRPSQVLSHQCTHQSARNANRKDAIFRKRRRMRPENFSSRKSVFLGDTNSALFFLYLVHLLLLRRRRRRRVQRRERYLCSLRCDLETCDFLRGLWFVSKL